MFGSRRYVGKAKTVERYIIDSMRAIICYYQSFVYLLGAKTSYSHAAPLFNIFGSLHTTSI